MRRQIAYHLAHARATAAGSARGERCVVATSVSRLVRTLDTLYAENGITIEQAVPETHIVRCPLEDLEEILGNLLDNACKWSRARVRVTSSESDDSVSIAVDDDGPGLEPAMASSALQRGVRADERVPVLRLRTHDSRLKTQNDSALDSPPARSLTASRAASSSRVPSRRSAARPLRPLRCRNGGHQRGERRSRRA